MEVTWRGRSIKKIAWFLLITVCSVFLCIFILTDKEAPKGQEAVSLSIDGTVLVQERGGREVVEDAIALASVQSLERSFKDFLSAGSAQEKALIASRIVRVIALDSDAEGIELDLAEATGALIGASGDGAAEVAVSIAKAAGAKHSDVVLSAIAIAASVGENSDAVCAAAAGALQEGSKDATQATAAQPDRVADERFRQMVLDAARSFKTVQDHWDPVQSKLTQDFFLDRDGGEKPCFRRGDLQTIREGQ